MVGEPRRSPASRLTGPSGSGSRRPCSHLTQLRVPSQGWLTVVSLPLRFSQLFFAPARRRDRMRAIGHQGRE
jgi:hypothetical protein